MANQAAQGPVTTIVPFGNRALLPPCAAACGHLYDANGACVPPVVPSNTVGAYIDCFCYDPRLTAFASTTAGVCDSACTDDPKGLASITAWYHSICSIQPNQGGPGKPSSTSTVGSSTSSGSLTGTNSPQRTNPPSGDWISTHWQWVVMLVILIVGITGIWIGACIWRRRYVRNRELRRQAGGNTESWGSGIPTTESGGIAMTYKANAASDLPNFTSSSEKRNTTTKLWPFNRS
ncbi:hypothetical protein V8C42DRAFT_331310 [Trichoderma barbatum]